LGEREARGIALDTVVSAQDPTVNPELSYPPCGIMNRGAGAGIFARFTRLTEFYDAYNALVCFFERLVRSYADCRNGREM
jgi:hypothetical protein